MYGVTHVCARDGYSGMIVAFTTMPIKNNLLIYDHIFRNTIQLFGIWDTVRIDGGKEFVLLSFVQEFLRHLRHNTSQKPVHPGKSTDNHVIERMWREVNERVNYPIKAALNTMVHNQELDMTNPTVKFCVSQVTCAVAAEGAKLFVTSWNSHRITGKGIPVKKAESRFCGIVPDTMLPSVDEAVELYYQHNGGNRRTLTIESTFGVDLLATTEQKETRTSLFTDRFKNIAEIFSSVVRGEIFMFRSALLFYIEITEQLASQNT